MSVPLCDCPDPEPCAEFVSNSLANPGRKFYCCATKQCKKWVWGDQVSTTLTLPGPKCRCGIPSLQKKSGAHAKNPHRLFWTCASSGGQRCKFFEWAEEPAPKSPSRPAAKAKGKSTEAQDDGGRNCSKCERQVTVNTVAATNTKGNAGRKYYKCTACKHFEFITLNPNPPAPPSSPATPGHVEYLVDEPKRRLLQALFDVPPNTQLRTGRDYRDTGQDYDYLHVECAWKVNNPSRRARFQSFCAKSTANAEGFEYSRPAYGQAVNSLTRADSKDHSSSS